MRRFGKTATDVYHRHMIVRNSLTFALLAVPFAIVAPSMVSAGGTQASGALPGVNVKAGDKVVVVAPSAEPTQDPASPDGNGWVRMGDWDVKISGSGQVDIGAGNIRPFRQSGGR